jgi:16S rRNA (uracil1498-N3)-methyltransferase
MNARFHVPGSYDAGAEVDLPADEAQHLTRVLRLRPGDAVRVFDGHGREFRAHVGAVTRNSARVVVDDRIAAAPEPQVRITIAHAVLKGDKMDDVVRDAVMVGAAAIQPIVTTRSEVSLAALLRSARQERWHRVAVSSVKQCGRAVVPPVLEPIPFASAIESLRQLTLPEPGLMLVEPSAATEAVSLTELDGTPPRQATVMIGPEGGWTPDEVEQGASVCRLVTLGGRTLRADAMATVALSALFTLWREF